MTLEPPPQGACVTLKYFGDDRRFRVLNEPEVADDGSFSLDVEQVSDGK